MTFEVESLLIGGEEGAEVGVVGAVGDNALAEGDVMWGSRRRT